MHLHLAAAARQYNVLVLQLSYLPCTAIFPSVYWHHAGSTHAPEVLQCSDWDETKVMSAGVKSSLRVPRYTTESSMLSLDTLRFGLGAWMHACSCEQFLSCKVAADAARNGAFIPSSSFLPLSTVPFELPTSVTVHLLPSQESSACFSDTALSLMWMSLARVRPTVSRFPAFESLVPSHGPLTASRERTAGSAGPFFCKSVNQD